jgi:ubiquitin C-terminal hydrolase
MERLDGRNGVVSQHDAPYQRDDISAMGYHQLLEIGKSNPSFDNARKKDMAKVVLLSIFFPAGIIYVVSRAFYCWVKQIPITLFWVAMRESVVEARSAPQISSRKSDVPDAPGDPAAEQTREESADGPSKNLGIQSEHLRLGPINVSNPVPQEHPVGPTSTDSTIPPGSPPKSEEDTLEQKELKSIGSDAAENASPSIVDSVSAKTVDTPPPSPIADPPSASTVAEITPPVPSDTLGIGTQRPNGSAPVGIEKCGSTCYANSAMQMFYLNKPFSRAIMALGKVLPTDDVRFKIFHAMAKVFSHLETGSGACPKKSMKDFLDVLQETIEFLGSNASEMPGDLFSASDATDFFYCILSNITTLCNKRVTQSEINRFITSNTLTEDDATALRQMGIYRPEIVDNSVPMDVLACLKVYIEDSMFACEDGKPGKILEKNCDEQSYKLTVNVHRNFYEEIANMELLDGDNQWNSDTRGKIDVFKGRVIKNAPQFLPIHIRRVKYNYMTEATEKNNAKFEFPMQLDFGPFTDVPNASLPYDLVGIVSHNGGHYITFVKNGECWYKIDDAVTCKVSEAEIKAQYDGTIENYNATMVFYAARSPVSTPGSAE